MFAQDSTGSAWDKLRVYDTNTSGIISGTERNPLRIWQDFNGNGISEANELKTLTEECVMLTGWRLTVDNHDVC